MDRIEIYIQMEEEGESFPVTSRELHQRVLEVFEFNRGRFNSRLPEGYKFEYTEEFYQLFQLAVAKFGLSYRAQFNLMKLALTAANLKGRRKMEKGDLLWVLRFRHRPAVPEVGW
jgi:predicted ATPase with chaperone activity